MGEWETVKVPLKSLVFTFRGRVATSAGAEGGGKAESQHHHQQGGAAARGPLVPGPRQAQQAGARTLGRSERARVMGLGLTLAATDDMPAEDDFRCVIAAPHPPRSVGKLQPTPDAWRAARRLDLAHVRACAGRTDPTSDLVRAQMVELSAEDEARLEWEQRALAAAKRLKPPGKQWQQ